MPTPPSKKLAILDRRRQVATLYLQGWTQDEIARETNVAQSTICQDLQSIRKEWRSSAVRDFDEARAMELQKIDQLERESWRAWERSQKPLQTAVVNGQGSGERSRKTITNQYGDPRFLEVVHRCIAQRRAILGLDAVTHSENTPHDDVAPDVLRTRLVAVLTELQQPRRVAADYPAPGSSQPRLAGPVQ